MALSLALDLIGGSVFDGLFTSVSRALDRKAAFTDLLQHMKCTLTSLRRQARFIREIQEYNLELGLSNNEMILLATKMAEATVLVGRLSSIKFRLWLFCCCCRTSNCAEQLKELNEVLDSLFETLQLEQFRDTKEILKLARQNHEDLEKMKVMLEKILQIIDDPEVKGLLKNLVEQNSRGSMESSTSTSTSASASGSNTEDEGNGGTQAASLEGLVEAAFRLLIDAVIEVKESSMMFRPLLRRLKSTLDCLRPFIEEMGQDNKVLDHPKEELEKLRIQMEDGVNLIGKCSSVCRWTSNKKDKYTNQVFELDEFLQGQLNILTVKVARDVKGTSELIRNIKEVVKRIEGSDMVQNRVEFQGSCDITEPPIPPVEFQGLCDITKPPVPLVKFQGSCDITEPPVPQETMPNVSEISNMRPFTVGLDVPLKELKRKLLNDGESPMIVLTGPAGCGKTTLAKTFCQDEEVKDKFKDNIFFVTISKKPSLDLIAEQILFQLKDCELRRVQNQVTAVEWLEQFLKKAGQNPLLLVLDDLWHVPEFLDNCDKSKIANHKILATSRSKLPGFGSPYYLNALGEEEAATLFRHSAFLECNKSYVPEGYLNKMVELCVGNPFALTVIGRSLCGMPTEIWEKRIAQLSTVSSIHDFQIDLRPCLEISYDSLPEILKGCFLDLSLFPEYQSIPADALIDMWTELYGLDEDILPIMNLHKLTTLGLAKIVGTRKEKVEVDGNYSELSFTMHDMIREIANHLTRQGPIAQRQRLNIEILGGKLPHWLNHLSEQKYQPMKARLVSISTDEVFSQKWHNMQLPQAEVLVLNFQTVIYALPEFVVNMTNLKVLTLTNCSASPAFWPVDFLPAELSNFQLLDSLPNLKTIRLERISIASIRMPSIQLKSLQKISLFNCHIGQTFSKTSGQFSDAFPNLVETKIDHCNDLVELPAICDLVNLEKLSLIHCYSLSTLPTNIGKLAKLEVLRLNSCTDLGTLPGSMRKLGSLRLLDLSYCRKLKLFPEFIGELSGLKTINMIGSRLQKLPPSVLYLKHLQEVICDEETKKLWEPFLPRLKNLRIKLRFPELHI